MISDASAELAAIQGELFSGMAVQWLEKTVAFLRKKAEVASFECAQIGTPDEVRRDLLATVRFCHGFADKAETALNARREAATSRGDGGFRQ